MCMYIYSHIHNSCIGVICLGHLGGRSPDPRGRLHEARRNIHQHTISMITSMIISVSLGLSIVIITISFL